VILHLLHSSRVLLYKDILNRIILKLVIPSKHLIHSSSKKHQLGIHSRNHKDMEEQTLVNVVRAHFVLSIAFHIMKAALRYAMLIAGEQSVMMAGIMLMLKLHADSLDTLLP
uniref:Uncharacterized protein n=1 Tax=Amphimedon queenslandica TaxID=400682 RepID=A0A1X7TSD6_AMPQE